MKVVAAVLLLTLVAGTMAASIGDKLTFGCITVNCFADPCSYSRCINHPNAVCKSNYCGGCNAEFYEGATKLTDCDNGIAVVS